MSLMIGIDESSGFVFEGASSYGGHLVYPAPILTPARFADALSPDYKLLSSQSVVRYFFREDTFDPVSRIRRGRFYKSMGDTQSWHVPPHPMVRFSYMGLEPSGMLRTIPLLSCSPFFVSVEFANTDPADMVAILGTTRASTIWSIIHIEGVVTGEELVTLKARQSFGSLPRLHWEKIPQTARANIQEKVTLLEDEYLRAGAESVVDQARETATAILSAFLQQQGVTNAKGKDLGDLVSLVTEKYGKQDKRIVACAAEIPQRLHSRRKSSEQEKRDLPPIREQDAQLAVQCIGTILCELGWAEWR